MALTPVDILHMQFKTSFRGYDKQHVDEFVRMVREALEDALTEKSGLQHRVESLDAELERIRKIESTMAGALTLAQKSADELKINAHREAEMILREAEQERVRLAVDAQRGAEKLRGDIASLQATRDRFEAEFRATLAAYQELLGKRQIAVISPSPSEEDGRGEGEPSDLDAAAAA